jgi:glycosyltransferase involved in cell wall biosynthesis
MPRVDATETAGGCVHDVAAIGWTGPGGPPKALAELEASYQALVQAGHRRVLGFISDHDSPPSYRGADVLVYPSRIEGFGLPMREA